MTVIHWTEIEGFHNIRKYTKAMPEVLNERPVITYRAKVKLHGNNAGIQIHTDGTVVAQSRTTELTIKNDLAGFAKWVDSIRTLLLETNAKGYVLYGEWCGQGIQSGVALNQLKNKVFALFAAISLDGGSDFITDPDALIDLLGPVADKLGIHVLPWYGEPIEVDWSADESTLTSKTAMINEWVMAVEQNDPWVEATFGIKGTGEGLVFYPTSSFHLGYANYCNFVFKAKGEAHRVVKAKASAQVNAESAEDANLFAGMVLTLARLEQGARAVSDDGSLTFNQKFIGKFLAWIAADVQKENQDELEASGLDWKQVQKPVGDKARGWYLSQMKK